jgi:hypothetical protein
MKAFDPLGSSFPVHFRTKVVWSSNLGSMILSYLLKNLDFFNIDNYNGGSKRF